MKDIGATRRRPYKSRKRYIEVPLELLPAEEDEPVSSPRSKAICSGAVDPFLALPVELDDLKRELVANSQYSRSLPAMLSSATFSSIC